MSKKKICGEIFGYVIRHPGETGELRYVFGEDPEELKRRFFEGFNPVCVLVRFDKSRIFDTETVDEDCKP